MDTPFLGALRPARSPNLVTRLLVAALLGTLLAAGSAPGTTAPASAVTSRLSAAQAQSYPAMATGTYEKRVQYWVNRKRRNHDLPRLSVAACTDRSAERWSSYLARNELFYHQSMEAILERCSATYAGETLGRGAISPRRLVRMWMDSEGHRHVLLSRESSRIGIGAKPDAYGRWVVAANFMRF
jgi:uncharacterized protein YkwD